MKENHRIRASARFALNAITIVLSLIVFPFAVWPQSQKARVSVTTDADCIWRLDGVNQGSLKKKDTAVVDVGFGKHLIDATSSDGKLLWEKSIEVSKPKTEKMKIGLVHDSPWINQALMWTGEDSHKDLTWAEAGAYCRDLRVGAYSGWRLPHILELKGVYSQFPLKCSADATGNGDCRIDFSVRGDFRLSGGQVWSADRNGGGTSGYLISGRAERALQGRTRRVHIVHSVCVM